MHSLIHSFPLFQTTPNAPALRDEAGILTYAELGARIAERKSVWIKRGVQEGTRIAFSVRNTLSDLLDILSLWECGAVVCPLNPKLPPSAKEGLLRRMTPITFWQGTACDVFEGQNPCTIPLATLLATSGTTAQPKIAAHTLNHYLYSASASIDFLQLSPQHSWHLSLPLYHVSGLSIIFRCLLSGALLTLMEKPFEIPISHFSLVPTQLFRILQNPQWIDYYKQATALIIGGATLSDALASQAKTAGLPIATTWGMTETTAMATFDGYVLPHLEVSLEDTAEIRVRGPSIFSGYLEEGIILSPLDSEGWFYTRDCGTLSRNGQMICKGRKDLQFISGGENIQPEEIEEALSRHPEILQAIVVPIRDKEFGSLPAAFIQSASLLSEETLRTWLGLHLPRFKIPRKFFSLPSDQSATAKPNRQALAALAHTLIP